MNWRDKGKNRPIRKLLVGSKVLVLVARQQGSYWGKVDGLDQSGTKTWREVDVKGYEKDMDMKR